MVEPITRDEFNKLRKALAGLTTLVRDGFHRAKHFPFYVNNFQIRVMNEREGLVQTLTELPSSGGFYMWTNLSSGQGLVQTRLDRMLVSDEWLAKWPFAALELLRGGTSDHTTQITRLCEMQGSC